MVVLWAEVRVDAVSGYALYIWPDGEARPPFSTVLLSKNLAQSTASHQVTGLVPGRLYQVDIEIIPNSAVDPNNLSKKQRTRKFVTNSLLES